MTDKCKEKMVPVGGRSVSFHLCFYKATKDGYCGVHHPDAVKRRAEKTEARWAEIARQREARYASEAFNRRAGDRCRALGIEPEEIKA